ncbi:MAG: hypothetical protein S4CHLAM102_03240 [Chlamydiia bacterium]|nr:hypothetical protein [Chlamydiia bacterium]
MRHILLAITLLFSTQIFAYYSGNPSTPNLMQSGLFTDENQGWVGGGLGYIFDQINDRKVRLKTGSRNDFDRFEITSNMGQVYFLIVNRFMGYGLLGAQEFSATQTSNPTTILQYISQENFSWGVGGKVLALELGPWGLGADAKYIASSNKWNTLTQNGALFPATNSTPRISYTEWQVSLSTSYRTDFLVPYLGIGYYYTLATFKRLPANFYTPADGINRTQFKVTNQVRPGLIAGAAVTPGKGAFLNIELRCIDSLAFSIQAALRF